MSKTYTMTIQFNESSTLAAAVFEPQPGKSGDILQFQAGDTINVKYAQTGNTCAPKVTSSILIAGPKQARIPESPFDADAKQIDLVQQPSLTIDNTNGVWGFSVSFAVQEQDATSFYYLPDPELQVGST